VGLSFSTAFGGYIFQEKSTTEMTTPMGTNLSTDYSTIYIDKGKIKSINSSDSSGVILRIDKGMLYFVDYAKKTYQEAPVSEIKAMTKSIMGGDSPRMKEAMKDLPKEQQDMMKDMMAKMFSPMSVSKTKETKSILGHKCDKYSISRNGKEVMEIWAAEDLGMGDEYLQFLEMISPGENNMFSEFNKIKGMTMESEMVMDIIGGMKSKNNTVMTDIKETKINPDEFEIPSGFKKEKSDLSKMLKH